MENSYIDILINKSNNIGSLCNIIKKDNEFQLWINNHIPLGCEELSLSEKIYYIINNIKEIKKCICGKPLSFKGIKNGYHKTCGNKECSIKVRKETNLIKYGVDNPIKNSEISDKRNKTIEQKWGSHYMLNDLVKYKFNTKMQERYGVDWAMQSDDIKNKAIETFNNNPDKKEIYDKISQKLKSKSIEEKKCTNNKRRDTIINNHGSYEIFVKNRLIKIKESALKKYGVDHHFKSDDIINKRTKKYIDNKISQLLNILPESITYKGKYKNSNKTDDYIELHCDICNTNTNITRQYLTSRLNNKENVCLTCNPKPSGTSKLELEVYEFIKNEASIWAINRHRSDGIECDIFIPSHNIAFEFNGLYWHSELFKTRSYHIDKKVKLLEQGIELIHIWEDDWIYKKKIVKGFILNKLGIYENKIGARKCEVRIIDDNSIVKKFLDENHIQGSINSSIKIGLYFSSELVSLMTFGKLRNSLGYKNKNGYELLRFCNKLGYQIIGGASKLFKYFCDNYQFNEVISYADYSRSNGNVYKKLGFIEIGLTEPNYWYIVDDKRKHRYSFRKDVLVKLGYDSNKTEKQIMESLNIPRIYDCGSIKYVFNK